MKSYILSKLSDLNYKLAIHEGDALRRLEVGSNKILLLPKSEIPTRFQKKFEKLVETIIETRKHRSPDTPPRSFKIRNSTAAKYLKLLIDIELELKLQE